MAVPNLSSDDVEKIIPNASVCGQPIRGGQKIVFPCIIDQITYAIKFILISMDDESIDSVEEISSIPDEILGRAKREITIMKACDSPYLVKIGTIDLCTICYNKQNLIYYSEEWVDGDNISNLLRDKPLNTSSVIRLGSDIAQAIEKLWLMNKVHRDIKPLNIMRRKADGSFVLLDFGMAFDLEDKSLTQYGFIPGTKMYFSPEQLDLLKKRDIDFRSDLFSLGIVMYEAITGKHPFYRPGMSDEELFKKILYTNPLSPQAVDSKIYTEISDIILRLLSKAPNGRYRKCSLLINQLQSIQQTLEV